MTEYCRRMLNDEENDAPGKCRERRRRRIERRRSAVMSQGNRPDSKRLRFSEPAATSSSSEDLESTGEAPIREPVFGTMSISGRSRHMEDAISVAELCREMMHVFLVEELNRLEGTHGGPAGEEGSVSCSAKEGEENENVTEMEEEYLWRKVMEKSFEKMDKAAIKAYPCSGVGLRCGSTAVVAVLTPDHIVVANCGDSRAVLCRGGGRAIPLSHDHKPDRSDERARIEGAGGRVIYVNGARVEGILAMSRAIGDQYLKPIVTSEPEVTFTKREAEDECLIIASDGLWDVLSSELACEVARECLREGALAVRSTSTMDSKTSTTTTTGPQSEDVTGNRGLYPSRSALAAALLTRLALGRKSADNVSVIVVDLRRG
ncbi:probable protein phosphatase 2C 75 isoform X3 [Humulus lupulus]|uniref:probable protein phosphatase 2C 75 isoform X3 n=1 Tax=Humulus lupulus TaxID=3486 RepID=UPI002B4112F4|nr:probable protein phosphatase 2C 75 isoform X3 [Humulus lupulus]